MSTRKSLGADIELYPEFLLGMDVVGPREIKELKRIYGCIGTKDAPLVVPEGFNVHRDNVFIEFAGPVTETPEQFSDMLELGTSITSSLVGTKLVSGDIVDVGPLLSALQAYEPPLYEAMLEFGCAPDMVMDNPWDTRDVLRSTKRAPYREMGGHLHLDLPDTYTDPVRMCQFVEDLDRALSLQGFSEIIDNFEDFTPHYRVPGIFRMKPYGVEYRSLGSRWIDTSDSRMRVASTCFDMMEEAA
jgi:hypothetical protein